MKLGTETASVNNWMMAGHVGAPAPVVGMGTTILGWTDRYPATVIAVSKSGRTVTVQEDTATRTDDRGMSDAQDYTFTPNPNGTIRKFRLGKRGWRESGSAGRGAALRLGERDRYYDFSF